MYDRKRNVTVWWKLYTYKEYYTVQSDSQSASYQDTVTIKLFYKSVTVTNGQSVAQTLRYEVRFHVIILAFSKNKTFNSNLRYEAFTMHYSIYRSTLSEHRSELRR